MIVECPASHLYERNQIVQRDMSPSLVAGRLKCSNARQAHKSTLSFGPRQEKHLVPFFPIHQSHCIKWGRPRRLTASFRLGHIPWADERDLDVVLVNLGAHAVEKPVQGVLGGGVCGAVWDTHQACGGAERKRRATFAPFLTLMDSSQPFASLNLT
jgi:hypothetical protein